MFAMSGATRNHNVIASKISRLLQNQLDGRGCDVYQSDMKVRITASGRFTYPDIAVVCGERQFLDDRQDVLLNPTVLIEVLSETTANYDRGDKSRDYRQLDSLRELLIVAQNEPLVEHFVRQDKKHLEFHVESRAGSGNWAAVDRLQAPAGGCLCRN